MLGKALSIAVLSIILPVHLSGQSSSGIIGWGQQVFDSALNDQAFVQVAAGNYHTVARRSDGSVVAWGSNQSSQCTVPALPSGLSYVEATARTVHTVARWRGEGTGHRCANSG